MYASDFGGLGGLSRVRDFDVYIHIFVYVHALVDGCGFTDMYIHVFMYIQTLVDGREFVTLIGVYIHTCICRLWWTVAVHWYVYTYIYAYTDCGVWSQVRDLDMYIHIYMYMQALVDGCGFIDMYIHTYIYIYIYRLWWMVAGS